MGRRAKFESLSPYTPIKRSGYKSTKENYGNWKTLESDPLWEGIREAKVRCRLECAEFDDIVKECHYFMVASTQCPKFLPRAFTEGVE